MKRIVRHSVRLRRRGGLTLFEIVLALAIFLGAMTALSQLITTGGQSAVQAHLRAEAAIRCESKLNEVVAGAIALTPVANEPFEDDPTRWVWSLAVSQTEIPNLLNVEVTAAHKTSNESTNASFTLRRYFRSPQAFYDAAAYLDAEQQMLLQQQNSQSSQSGQ